MNPELQEVKDELDKHESKDPYFRLGAAMQMVVTARAERDFWRELAKEYREERDHAEELFAKGGM